MSVRPVLAAALVAGLLVAEEPARREPVPTVKQIGPDTLRHGGPVRAVLHSPDGKAIFSAAEDGTVSRWDAKTGAEQARFVGPVGFVRALALSPDGKTLASGGSDKVVRLYDAQAAGKAGVLEVVNKAMVTPRMSSVECLAFDPSGATFFVGLEEGTWLQYDAATTKELAGREVGDPVRALAVLPGGKQLLAPRGDGGLVVWRVDNPRKLHEAEGESPRSLAVSPDGTRAAVGDFAGELAVRRMPDGEVVWKKKAATGVARRREVTAVAFAPDGKSIVTAGLDGEVRHWDAATGEELGKFAGVRSPVLALAFSPDGTELLTGHQDGLIERWNPATRQPRGGGPAAAFAVRSVALRPDGERAVLVVGKRLQLHQGKGLEPLPVAEPLARHDDLRAAELHGDAVLLQTLDGAVVRAALDGTGEAKEILPASVHVVHIAVGGGRLAALSGYRHVHVIDLDGKEAARQLGLDGDIGKAVAASPDGKYVAAVATAAVIRTWDAATGRLLHEVDAALGGGLAVAFSPDSRLVVAAGRDRMVRVVEAATGKPRQEIPVGSGYPTSLALTPDGRFLAVGTSAGGVALYDFDRGVLLDQLDGHRGAVTTVAFQKGTNALVSVGNDGVLYLRDVAAVLKANKPQPLTLTRQQLEEHWAQLGLQDARGVALAIQALVRAEAETMPWLKARLQPIDAKRVQTLLKDLGSDDFETRDGAMRELGRMGKAVEGALKASRESPDATLDKRVRIEELLDRIAENKATPEYLQALRGIEVLERVGTAEAKGVLEKVAGGLPEAEVTRQSRAALERLKERK